MIIGVDTRIPTKNKTGIAYLLESTMNALLEIDNKNQYSFLGDDLGNKGRKNVKVVNMPKIVQRGFNFLWKYFRFPPANIILGKTDAFFFPNFSDFPVFSKKKILMVPDLSYIVSPQFTQKKNRSFLKKNVGPSIRRASRILTISENAKKEIMQYYGVMEKKITVIYPSCPGNVHRVTDNEKIKEVKNKYNITGDYILFVGTLEPRKNIEGLIKAFSSLDSNLKDRYRLVISGGKGWYYDKIFMLAKELGLLDKVVFTGYVANEDISSIYSGASLFVFPSFYEGFGLPVLQAFACGVPVVVSNNSSLPEVGGEAVIYCDAEKIETIKSGIETILLNDNLKKELIKKGFDQLRKFSWEESASKILRIIED